MEQTGHASERFGFFSDLRNQHFDSVPEHMCYGAPGPDGTIDSVIGRATSDEEYFRRELLEHKTAERAPWYSREFRIALQKWKVSQAFERILEAGHTIDPKSIDDYQ